MNPSIATDSFFEPFLQVLSIQVWNLKIAFLLGKSYVYLQVQVYIAKIVYLQVYHFGYVYL